MCLYLVSIKKLRYINSKEFNFFLLINIKVNFTALRKPAEIQPVTDVIDSKANKNEVSFKCSIECSDGDCSVLGGVIYWYSNNSVIDINSIKYNQDSDELYDFLPESTWTNYINKNVKRFNLSLQIKIKAKDFRLKAFKN